MEQVAGLWQAFMIKCLRRMGLAGVFLSPCRDAGKKGWHADLR